MTKLKSAGLTLMAASGLASLGVAAGACREIDPPPSPAPSQALAPTPIPAGGPGVATIRGMVVDPTGRPVDGARVEAAAESTNFSLFESSPTNPVAITTADGRFELVLTDGFRAEVAAADLIRLTAAARGFGVGWAAGGDTRGEPVIRLADEGPPIEERIVDEQGVPVAGASAVIHTILAPRPDPHDASPAATLARLLAGPSFRPLQHATERLPVRIAATTDADGRFTLRGIGPDRVAKIAIAGPTIANTAVNAANRAGVRVDLKFHTDHASHTWRVEPRRFDLTAGPTRIVAGVVRDAASGRPLPGWVVNGSSFDGDRYGPGHEAATTTDAEGRYRLVGLPPFEQYSVRFDPPAGQPYLRAHLGLKVEPGRAPVAADLSAPRAVLLRGRITDASTDRPLAGMVQWRQFPTEPKVAGFPGFYADQSGGRPTDADGRYELAVPPGRGVVAFRGPSDNRYPTGQGAERLPGYLPQYRSIQSPTSSSISTTDFHRLVEVNTPPGAESATLDLQVGIGGTIALTILDPAGQPLEGTEVLGTGEFTRGLAHFQPTSVATILALTPDRPRDLVVWHLDRKFVGTAKLDQAGGPAQSIKLGPWGEVRGRIVQPDGSPRGRLGLYTLERHYPDQPRAEGSLIHPETLSHGGIATDPAGRFQIRGLIPGQTYRIVVTDADDDAIGTLTTDLAVGPGEVKDLGDVLVSDYK